MHIIKYTKTMIILPLIATLFLAIASNTPTYSINILAIPNITATTNKQSYYIREEVTISGNLTSQGQPVSDRLVALEVRSPRGLTKPVAYRTIPIGNPTEQWEINITDAQVRDYYTGNPINRANINDDVKFYVRVRNNLAIDISILVTITVYDGNMIPLFASYMEGTVSGQGSFSPQWTFQIPNWAYSGRATVFYNVYTKLPAEGGYPLTPEKTIYFYITRNKEAGLPYAPLLTTYTSSPGKFSTSFKVSPDRYSPPGNYTVYAAARMIPYTPKTTTFFSVQSVPSPPQAAFTYSPLKAYANMSILFDASSSSAEGYNDTIIRYEWRINDPYNMTHLIYSGNFTHPPSPKTSHPFPYGGTYIVELNVTDNEGLWSTTSKPITILPEFGPTANFTWSPLTPLINQPALFNASGSTLGWCARTKRFSPIVSYSWNFSDGTGIWTTPNSTIQHIFTQAKNYLVALTVTDADGRSHTAYNIIQVVNKTKPWDLNGDGKTDMKDVAIVAKAFGSQPGYPNWNPIADITGPEYLVPDGKVDMRDVSLVAKHFGET